MNATSVYPGISRAAAAIRMRKKPADGTHSVEWERCANDPAYFIDTYCQVYDAEASNWIPFRLWDAQREALRTVHDNQLSIILKSRQIGMTWLLLGYALWQMIYKPIATVLIFSKRDDEAVYLLGEERLRGMYKRLPLWMQANAVKTDDKHQWALSNGSVARAFPTSGGDGYTATLAIVDEADLVPDLARLLGSAKPTIDAGGKMALISRVDKGTPNSRFKQIYRAGKQKANGWAAVFLPWHVHPGRDQAWYERQKKDVLHTTGALDDLHEQYPATDVEALAPRTLDKRIAPQWLLTCYQERQALPLPDEAPAIPQLELYELPQPGHEYCIGADPAEGNPTSDDSALTVLDVNTGEEVAALSGKFEPSVFASYINQIGLYYFNASALIERNNHGHAVILWMRDNGSLFLIYGWDQKVGWLSNSRGKALLYDGVADALRDGTTTIHSFATYTQLGSIEGATLRAPEGEHDDRADSYGLAEQGRANSGHVGQLQDLDL